MPEMQVDNFNDTGLPAVQLSRLPWWMRFPTILRVYLELKNAQLQTWLLEVLGVNARLRYLQNALDVETDRRQKSDTTLLDMLSQHAAQVNVIARSMPDLVKAKKRLAFHEEHCLPLTNSYARFKREEKEENAARARAKLTLEKSTNGQGANDHHAGSAGAGREVPESAGSHAPGEDGQAGVSRADDDRREEGRGEVQGDVAAVVGVEIADDHTFAEITGRYDLRCIRCGVSTLVRTMSEYCTVPRSTPESEWWETKFWAEEKKNERTLASDLREDR